MAQPSNTISNRQVVKQSGLTAAVAAATAAWFVPGGQPVAAFLTTFALAYGMSVASTKLAARGWKQEVVERRDMIRSGTAPRRVVFGAVRTSGVLALAQVQGTSKEHLHLVLVLTGHEVHSIGDIWFDDVRLGDLDGSGNVTTGQFAGLVRVKKYLGTTSQTADADAIAENVGKWTSTDRLQGRAYLYLRLVWDQDRLPAIPSITALVRGVKVLDTRDGVTRFSENPALLLRHYLTASYGLACDTSKIDAASVTAAADYCEGWVSVGTTSLSMVPDHTTDTWSVSGTNDATLSTGDRFVLAGTPVPTGLTSGNTYYVIRRDQNLYQIAADYQLALEGVAVGFASNGSGTQTWGSIEQRRYTANGSFLLDQSPPQIEDALRSCMAGATVYTQGLWRVYAGAYTAPSISITASDLRDALVSKPRKPRKDLTNSVSGTFTDPAHGWVSTQFPPVADSTYIAQDGGQTMRQSIDLAWCTNAFRAQRIAKILLRRSRAAQLILPCKIGMLKATTAETVSVTLPQIGYSGRAMRVVGWKLAFDDGIGVDLVLEEDDANVYSWTASEGIPPLQWNNPEQVDRATVGVPTALVLASGTSHLLLGGDGSIVSRILATWTAAVEPNAAQYEVQWKPTSSADWSEATFVAASNPRAYLAPVLDGISYDVRVRTIRLSGQRSAWLTGSHTVIGKTAAPTTPASLTTTSVAGGVRLQWAECPDPDYGVTQIYEAAVNDWTDASRGLIAEIKGTQYTRTGMAPSTVGYYWVVFKDTTGNTSDRFPTTGSGNAGVAGTAGSMTLGTNAVDTINIVSAAVTDVTSAYTAATVVISAGTWTTVQSITVTTTGEPLLVKSTAHANTNAGVPNFASHQVRIQRDGTTIYGPVTPTAYVMADGFVAVALLDTPSAGTYTYTLDLFPSHGCGVDGRYLEALETKR